VSESEVTDLHDADELAEADTVVAAQAFEITAVSAEAYEATVPPEAPATDDGEKSASAAAEATASDTTESQPAADPGTSGPPVTREALGTTPSEAPEDLSDADMSLLEPLPEQEPPQVGAIFRGRIGAVAESGHIAIVNRVVDKAAVRKALRAAREEHRRVQGVVYGFNRGGFDVLVGGVRAFCPASAMSLTPIEDPNTLIGQRCEFSLPKDKGGKKSIIVSRRNILEKEARKRARERMAELEVGQKIEGKVLEVRDYGVLVDLGGGLDGLVHMSEVSWSRGVRPQDVANVGDEVEVQVLKVQPATRKDRFGRVSLSMRACQPDPWDEAGDFLRPGTPAKGKVVRTTDFGAFVQIKENIEGLLHISELGGNKELTHAKQAVSEGDEIDVVIERVDKEQRRISLSKLSEADAQAIEAGEIEIGKAPRSLKPGSHISVVVKRVEHGGAQVQVDGVLGKRGRGFIPNRELQDVRGEKRKGPSQGDVIEVKVIGTERDGTLRCSVRARLLDEERKAVREYRKESAKQGLGTFGDLLKAKLGDND
jgi:small subunit ribosomal protein S1